MALSPDRKGRITGSRIGAILGVNPWSTPADALRSMVRDYHGAESEFTGNVATEYGKFHEDYARADFELETGYEVVETGDEEKFYIHPDNDWLGSTPDGRIPFASQIDEGLEIKCPYGKRNDSPPTFKTPAEQPHYMAQVQYEMFCAGTCAVHFYQWSNKSSRLDKIDFDQNYIDITLPKLKAFYDLYLSEIDNPEHLEPLIREIPHSVTADEYKIAKEELEAAKDKVDKLKELLIHLAEGKKSRIAGLLVSKVEKKGAVSYSKIVKEHCKGLDLEPYRGKASEYWMIK